MVAQVAPIADGDIDRFLPAALDDMDVHLNLEADAALDVLGRPEEDFFARLTPADRTLVASCVDDLVPVSTTIFPTDG